MSSEGPAKARREGMSTEQLQAARARRLKGLPICLSLPTRKPSGASFMSSLTISDAISTSGIGCGAGGSTQGRLTVAFLIAGARAGRCTGAGGAGSGEEEREDEAVEYEAAEKREEQAEKAFDDDEPHTEGEETVIDILDVSWVEREEQCVVRKRKRTDQRNLLLTHADELVERLQRRTVHFDEHSEE